MQIADAQHEVRHVFLGGFVGQLVSSLLWTASAALATWSTPRLAITVLVIGGFIGVVNRTGAFDAGIRALARRLEGREAWLIVIVTALMALGGSTFGMAEETLAFYPVLVPVFLAAGYDARLPAMQGIGYRHLAAVVAGREVDRRRPRLRWRHRFGERRCRGADEPAGREDVQGARSLADEVRRRLEPRAPGDTTAREERHVLVPDEPARGLGDVPRVRVLGREDDERPAELLVERECSLCVLDAAVAEIALLHPGRRQLEQLRQHDARVVAADADGEPDHGWVGLIARLSFASMPSSER